MVITNIRAIFHLILPFHRQTILNLICSREECIGVERVEFIATSFRVEHGYEDDYQGSQVENCHWHQKANTPGLNEPTAYLVVHETGQCASTRGRAVGDRRIYQPNISGL